MPTDAVADLNRRLQAGGRELQFDGPSGYLKSLLAALDIPVESQLAVYSKTSLQGVRINPRNPRVIFFNDSTAVAWVPGGFIEVATHDARQGAVFYLLDQTPTPRAATGARRAMPVVPPVHRRRRRSGIPRSQHSDGCRRQHDAVAGQCDDRPSHRAAGTLGRLVRDLAPRAGSAPGQRVDSEC